MHFTMLIKNYIFKEISFVNPWPWIIITIFSKLSTITGVAWIICCNKGYCQRVYTFSSGYIPTVWYKYFIPWWKHGILSWVIRSNKCSCHKIGVVSWRAQQTSWSIQAWIICATRTTSLQMNNPVLWIWIATQVKDCFRTICSEYDT